MRICKECVFYESYYPDDGGFAEFCYKTIPIKVFDNIKGETTKYCSITSDFTENKKGDCQFFIKRNILTYWMFWLERSFPRRTRSKRWNGFNKNICPRCSFNQYCWEEKK